MQGLLGADPSAKLVACALADCANVKHNGIAFPSVAMLMHRTGLSERRVQIHLRELVAGGWIEPVGATHGGRGMSTRYRLNLAKMRANIHKKGGAHDTHSHGQKGDVGDGDKGTINGVASDRVSDHLNPVVHGRNPVVHGIKTPSPATPEPELTGRDRGNPTFDVQSLRSILNPLREGKIEPEKVVARKVVAKHGHHRTQAEQVAWIEAEMRKKAGTP